MGLRLEELLHHCFRYVLQSSVVPLWLVVLVYEQSTNSFEEIALALIHAALNYIILHAHAVTVAHGGSSLDLLEY